jgi:hypothetical protein
MTRLRAARAALAALAAGAVLVHAPLPAAAAPASPADGDACESGGWQHLLDPILKRQGVCVRYVNAHGTGSPAGATATPELGSLILFASGATALAGSAWERRSAGRSRVRTDAPDESPAP